MGLYSFTQKYVSERTEIPQSTLSRYIINNLSLPVELEIKIKIFLEQVAIERRLNVNKKEL